MNKPENSRIPAEAIIAFYGYGLKRLNLTIKKTPRKKVMFHFDCKPVVYISLSCQIFSLKPEVQIFESWNKILN